MMFPVTLTTLCILAAIYAVLSIRVGMQRGRANVSLGMPDATIAIGQENTAPPLLVAIRRHAQFAEYVPLSILLLLLLEMNRANAIALIALATMLILSRTSMMIGIGRVASPFRAAGNLLQWSMLLAASVFGLALLLLRGSI